MEKATPNPFLIGLFFFIRCIVPLMLMLGVSYLLRKLGIITEPPSKTEQPNGTSNNIEGQEGGFAHGKP